MKIILKKQLPFSGWKMARKSYSKQKAQRKESLGYVQGMASVWVKQKCSCVGGEVG